MDKVKLLDYLCSNDYPFEVIDAVVLFPVGNDFANVFGKVIKSRCDHGCYDRDMLVKWCDRFDSYIRMVHPGLLDIDYRIRLSYTFY